MTAFFLVLTICAATGVDALSMRCERRDAPGAPFYTAEICAAAGHAEEMAGRASVTRCEERLLER